MEPRFGHDFGQVRVHTGEQAAESARAVSALAYTVGSDLVFGAGQYAPGTSEGQRLIAHELAHVVQQSTGPVSGVPMADGLAVSEPGDSFERAADQAAEQVMSGDAAGYGAGVSSPQAAIQRSYAGSFDLPSLVPLTLQRIAVPELGSRLTIQRDDDDEEELEEEQITQDDSSDNPALDVTGDAGDELADWTSDTGDAAPEEAGDTSEAVADWASDTGDAAPEEAGDAGNAENDTASNESEDFADWAGISDDAVTDSADDQDSSADLGVTTDALPGTGLMNVLLGGLRSAGLPDGTDNPQRMAILNIAAGETSKGIYARRSEPDPDDPKKRIRPGWERLLEIFHLAAPSLWSDQTIKYNPQPGMNGLPHWCGIFALWAIKSAGVDVGTWVRGPGISGTRGLRPVNAKNVKVGDIGYLGGEDQHQHHFVVAGISSDGKTITSIDGNSVPDSTVSQGKTRSITEITAFFTAFEKGK